MQADNSIEVPAEFQNLPVNVPPMLEEALDYRQYTLDEACYVSFYWSPFGDEAMFDDGRTSGTADWQGYLALVEHPAVKPHLLKWRSNLGSSEELNTHRLLLDRLKRKLYMAEDRPTCLLLKRQWEQPNRELAARILEAEPAGISEVLKPAPSAAGLLEELLVVDEWQEVAGPPPSVILSRLQRRQEVVAAMFRWLSAPTCQELSPEMAANPHSRFSRNRTE